MEESNDLSSFVVDESVESSTSHDDLTRTTTTRIPLSPLAEEPLAGESNDESSSSTDRGAPGMGRSKSTSPPARGRSKSPGTRRAIKKSIPARGENDGLGNKLGGGSSHGRRKALGGPSSIAGPRISWKSDPKSSYCDWRIEVQHMTKKGDPLQAVDVYNIHRNVVGFGPRKSNFMVQEFNRQIDECNYGSGSNITKLSLPFWQAEAFPMVLDFMYYTKEVKQTLTAERACSVIKIAEQLGIPPLEDAIENFYQKTISLKNMTEFMAAATNAKADRLLFAARAKIGSLILEKPELAGLLLPKFMIDILQVNRQQVREIQAKTPERYPEELKLSHSRIWSKAAYVCASHNAKVMTKEIFDAMTHEDCLPAIDASVAFKFLMMDANFDPDNTEYKNLQKRCVQGITDNWEGFQKGYASPAEVSKEIHKLPSPVLADILMKSMSR